MKTLNYPVSKAVKAKLTLPGSKYLANRLIILSALCGDQSQLFNMPHNEDIDTAIKGLTTLGAEFRWEGDILYCKGIDNLYKLPETKIYSHHSGSFSRFISPLLALSESSVSLSGSDKMNTRPMAELFRALKTLGANISSTQGKSPSTLPVTIRGPITGGEVEISGAKSSQFISALLMVAGKLKNGLVIRLPSQPVSKPYLLMTIELMQFFGVQVEADEHLQKFVIKPGQNYQGTKFDLESDPSSASYFLAAAAISGGEVCISNYNPEHSIQGEALFSKVLESMGCKIWCDNAGFHCKGPEKLKAVTVNMGDMPDVVQTLAVVAVFAEGTTKITHIESLAFKESNRIEDTAKELSKTGIKVVTTESSLTIEGGEPKATTFETYDDHRMAMSLSLMALKVKGIKVCEPDVVGKSFPDYWNYLEKLGYSFVDH